MTDDLSHNGVPGMKWGRGKYAETTHVAKGSAPTSEDHNTVAALKGKKVSELSNHELKQINQRMELTKKFSELNAKTTPVAKGMKYGKAVLATAGTGITVYNMVKSPAGQATIKAVKTAVNANK